MDHEGGGNRRIKQGSDSCEYRGRASGDSFSETSVLYCLRGRVDEGSKGYGWRRLIGHVCNKLEQDL